MLWFVQDDDLRLDPFWQEKIPHFGTTRLGSGEAPALRRMLLASKSFPVGETLSKTGGDGGPCAHIL
jgi:hypothetical protein